MKNNWTICLACQGFGKKRKKLRKKIKLQFQRELQQFEQNNRQGQAPIRPKGHLDTCVDCKGSGLTTIPAQTLSVSESQVKSQQAQTQNYPHLAIIGAGIGGVALAVACLHRGIPFTLYERDSGFDTRSQGYGLTLQQASNAIAGLGIFSLAEGVTSTRHAVHTTDGKVIADWGIRMMAAEALKTPPKRTNVHIARQSLRLELLEQLGGHEQVMWGHQLLDYKESAQGNVELSFQLEGESEIKHGQADLVVGADGIRSSVRSLLIGEDSSPLRYLDCIVILGICPLNNIEGTAGFKGSVSASLLDSATVFQTANGHERIYMMPFNADSIMWQLSFPLAEQEAKALSAKGPAALKQEALRRCQWHDPIPQILAATQVAQVTGYPVYDRAPLKPEQFEQAAKVTLIGDAAHPMSPFKGQGANQALLDALALARGITQGCRPLSQWRESGLRASVLTEFEADMLARSGSKVKDSAEAAQFLHSEVVLHEGNEPRGRVLLRQITQEKDTKG